MVESDEVATPGAVELEGTPEAEVDETAELDEAEAAAGSATSEQGEQESDETCIQVTCISYVRTDRPMSAHT